MIGVALVVAEEGSEAVGASGGEGLEGEAAGEGKRWCKALLYLAYLLSEAFGGRIPSCMWISQSRIGEHLKHHKKCTYVCNQLSPFSMGALGIY